jgi:hypothetical protein
MVDGVCWFMAVIFILIVKIPKNVFGLIFYFDERYCVHSVCSKFPGGGYGIRRV